MIMDLEHRGKAKLLKECGDLGLPVNQNDSMECLELVYSLARNNGWLYRNDGSVNDQKIDKTIKKIRNFIEFGTYTIN